VWEVLAGWQQPLDDATSLESLPPEARRYVEFVSNALAIPIELVGIGAAREHVLS
jgi:adenylosuccinate synthase